MTTPPLRSAHDLPTSHQWRERFLVFIIVALAPIGQMAIDIFVPSLPVIAAEFATDRATVQLSVTMYLAVFAVGQLVYGPLSDSLGRRHSLILGFTLFLAGSLISIFASDVEWFILGRVVQGAGITAASVVMRAIATDSFQGPRLTQVLTYMVIGWGAGPIIAPIIGAGLQTTIGWRYSLVLLAAYALILLALVAGVMKETNRKPVPFNLVTIGRGIIEIYGSRRFRLVFLAMGLCYGSLLSFNLSGPFIVQTVMGHGPGTFGVISLVMGTCYFAGVFSNRLLPAKFTAERKFKIASTLALTGAALQTVFALVFDLQLWALALPFACVVFFSGVLYPNLMALGVSAFPQRAGLASALLGFSLMLLSAVVMGITSSLQVHSMVPFALLTLALMTGVMALIRRLHA